MEFTAFAQPENSGLWLLEPNSYLAAAAIELSLLSDREFSDAVGHRRDAFKARP
ncbi:hypothetical protein ABQE44_12870 [Mycolicibacterium sp. XJ2546]